MYIDYRKYRILLPENASLLDKDSKNFRKGGSRRSSPTPFSPPASAFAHCVGKCLASALKKLSSRAINNFFYLCRFHPFTLCLHLLTTFILWNEWHPNIKNHRVSLWEIFYKWNNLFRGYLVVQAGFWDTDHSFGPGLTKIAGFSF